MDRYPEPTRLYLGLCYRLSWTTCLSDELCHRLSPLLPPTRTRKRSPSGAAGARGFPSPTLTERFAFLTFEQGNVEIAAWAVVMGAVALYFATTDRIQDGKRPG